MPLIVIIINPFVSLKMKGVKKRTTKKNSFGRAYNLLSIFQALPKILISRLMDFV